MRFIKDLIYRRIPHIIGSYLIAGTSLILFVDWLVNRYTLPEYYTTLCLFGVIAIMPSVFILAYFHGAPGKDQWTKIERIGVPVNLIFIFLVLFIGHRNHWWIAQGDSSVVINENILIGKCFSSENDVNFINETVIKHGLENYDSFKNIKLNVVSHNNIDKIYEEISYYVNKKNNYLVNFININEIEDIYIKKGDILQYYDLRSEMDLIRNEFKNPFNYIGILRDSSLNNVMLENKIKYSLSSIIYEIENPIGDNNLLYLMIGRYVEKMGVDTIYAKNDTIIDTKIDAGFSINEFALANDDDIADLISNDYLSEIQSYIPLAFHGRIASIADDKIIITFDSELRQLVVDGSILEIKRVYGSTQGGVEKRIEDLLNYKREIESDKINEYIKLYNENQGGWTKSELYELQNNSHTLHTNNVLFWETEIPSYLKIQKIYDSTLVASYFKKVNPYIKIKLDDKIYLK